MKITAGTTHGGTALIGAGRYFKQPEVKCDCGIRFPAERHPVERDHFESPQWEHHFRAMRRAGI